MTVKELKEKLSEFDENMMVYTPQDDIPDYRHITDVELRHVYENVHGANDFYSGNSTEAIIIA